MSEEVKSLQQETIMDITYYGLFLTYHPAEYDTIFCFINFPKSVIQSNVLYLSNFLPGSRTYDMFFFRTGPLPHKSPLLVHLFSVCLQQIWVSSDKEVDLFFSSPCPASSYCLPTSYFFVVPVGNHKTILVYMKSSIE